MFYETGAFAKFLKQNVCVYASLIFSILMHIALNFLLRSSWRTILPKPVLYIYIILRLLIYWASCRTQAHWFYCKNICSMHKDKVMQIYLIMFDCFVCLGSSVPLEIFFTHFETLAVKGFIFWPTLGAHGNREVSVL